MGAHGRPRLERGRGKRKTSDSQNRQARRAPQLQAAVIVRRHRFVPAERSGRIQSVRVAGVHQQRKRIRRQTGDCHRMG